jgi:phage-related protein
MPQDVNATFNKEQTSRESISIIDMYVLNISVDDWDPLYFANYNQNILGFQLDESGDLLDATTLYIGLPIQRDSISNNIEGEVSEVSISIPNTDRSMESYIQDYDYLRGRDIYVLTGFTKHLPSGTQAIQIGSVPDRFAIMKEKLYIDSATSDQSAVSFSCKPKFLIRNKMFPGRTFSFECSWTYGGTECAMTNATTVASYPTCDKTLEDCRERKNIRRFGGFISIPRKGITII